MHNQSTEGAVGRYPLYEGKEDGQLFNFLESNNNSHNFKKCKQKNRNAYSSNIYLKQG